MCLITEQTKPEILKEDLIVYKILYYGNLSYFRKFVWEKGKMERQKMDPKIINTSDHYNGKYTFCDDISQAVYDNGNKYTCISYGFHAFVTKKRAGMLYTYGTEIHKFLIPAGAQVFRDKTGLIVSNKMMFVE